MRIANQKIVDSIKALDVLDGCKLTVKGAFAMRKNRARLLAEATHINEAYADLLKKHFGSLPHADEKHPNWGSFKKDTTELMAVEVEIEPQRIRMGDILDSAPGLIKALNDLDWLIDETS